MYILSKTLTIEGWHLFLTGVSVCVFVAGFVMNLNRARKKDFDTAMKQKADKDMVEKDFEIIKVKIGSLEKILHNQNDVIITTLNKISTIVTRLATGASKIEHLEASVKENRQDIKDLKKAS